MHKHVLGDILVEVLPGCNFEIGLEHVENGGTYTSGPYVK